MTIHKVKYPFAVKHLSIHDSIDVAYCDEGNGEQTLVFIHGLANYLSSWKYQIKTLKNKFRCVAMDLPGNGLSSRGDYPYSMFFYAECVYKLIEQLNLKNVVICGHSMGGQIAIILALRYPHLIEKLILIAPAGFENFNSRDVLLFEQGLSFGNMFYSDEAGIESSIMQSFYLPNKEANHIISDLKNLLQNQSLTQWKAMCKGSIMGMLNEQVSQYIQNITCNTLIIFGNKDHFIPNKILHPFQTTEEIAKYGEAVIINSKLLLVPNAGHFVHIEKHDVVTNSISSFLLD